MGKEHASADPEGVEQIKGAILDQWRRLPPDEQAAVMAEQLQSILDSEAGAPLREALETEAGEPDPLNRIFPITGVSRADLLERLHFSQQDIWQLEDQDMREIAGRLEDHYVELSFWGDLDYVAREVLTRKRRLSAQK